MLNLTEYSAENQKNKIKNKINMLNLTEYSGWYYIYTLYAYYIGVPGRGPIGSSMPAPHVFFIK